MYTRTPAFPTSQLSTEGTSGLHKYSYSQSASEDSLDIGQSFSEGAARYGEEETYKYITNIFSTVNMKIVSVKQTVISVLFHVHVCLIAHLASMHAD